VQNLIEVPVREEFRIVAGTWREEAGSDGGILRVVEPPAVDLFSQVVEYLDAQPEVRLPRFSTVDEAIATVGVCLRWGSYFALPADRTRPLWTESRNARVSLIADAEMKRINIEASSALERWLEIRRTDRERWYRLVARAVRYLPMETRSVRRDRETMLAALSHAEIARQIPPLINPELLTERRGQVQKHPTRVLANAIMNRSWRNGPVEDLHAGTRNVGPPLELCRLTLRDCRSVLRSVLGGVADAMWALAGFERDPEQRSWEEQVLPYHIVDSLLSIGGFLITPSEWTLTEHSCTLRLAGSEQEARLPIVR
jgi:hypothetical protein